MTLISYPQPKIKGCEGSLFGLLHRFGHEPIEHRYLWDRWRCPACGRETLVTTPDGDECEAGCSDEHIRNVLVDQIDREGEYSPSLNALQCAPKGALPSAQDGSIRLYTAMGTPLVEDTEFARKVLRHWGTGVDLEQEFSAPWDPRTKAAMTLTDAGYMVDTDGPLGMLTVGEAEFARTSETPLRLSAAERAIWLKLLASRTGWLVLPDVALAPASSYPEVREAVLLAFRLTAVDYPVARGVGLNRSFLSRLGGFPDWTAKRGVRSLHREGVIRPVGTERSGKAKPLTLWVPCAS